MTASGLKVMTNGNFIDAGHLLQIIITRNKIEYVDDSAFEGAKITELLNLSYNRIKMLSNKAFNGLKKLQ